MSYFNHYMAFQSIKDSVVFDSTLSGGSGTYDSSEYGEVEFLFQCYSDKVVLFFDLASTWPEDELDSFFHDFHELPQEIVFMKKNKFLESFSNTQTVLF